MRCTRMITGRQFSRAQADGTGSRLPASRTLRVLLRHGQAIFESCRSATGNGFMMLTEPPPPVRSILFVAPVWPEVSSSAAGVRTSALVSHFLRGGSCSSDQVDSDDGNGRSTGGENAGAHADGGSSNSEGSDGPRSRVASPPLPPKSTSRPLSPWRVSFLCTSDRNGGNPHEAALVASGVTTYSVKANRTRELAEVLNEVQPSVVVFDRFYAEEQFSFRVREMCPDALHVLDMQDFHSLREWRGRLLKETLKAPTAASPKAVFATNMGGGGGAGEAMPHASSSSSEPLPLTLLTSSPDASDPMLLRELASIHRSDLTLVCSRVEMRLLCEEYGVAAEKLVYAPFFVDEASCAEASARPGFDQRSGFITIGTFKHPPNVDAVRWLRKEVWPRIRRALPHAELRVYGSYAPTGGALRGELHAPSEGFLLEGFAPSLDVLDKARVMLAPVRYGAGLKGKVVDAWLHGTPVVATPCAAEGLTREDASSDYKKGVPAAGGKRSREDDGGGQAGGGSLPKGTQGALGSDTSDRGQQEEPEGADGADGAWGGLCSSDSADAFAADAVRLHEDQALWLAAQKEGFRLLPELFDASQRLGGVSRAVSRALELGGRRMRERRGRDYVGAMLWHHTARSTEFFSRWIELKEGNAAAAAAVAAGAAAAAADDRTRHVGAAKNSNDPLLMSDSK